MKYIEKPEGWEKYPENDADAIEILAKAMFISHLYGDDYYPQDIRERMEVKTGHGDPVGTMMFLVAQISSRMQERMDSARRAA